MRLGASHLEPINAKGHLRFCMGDNHNHGEMLLKIDRNGDS